MIIDQLGFSSFPEIYFNKLVVVIRDFENPTHGFVMYVGVRTMALVFIVPVYGVNRAVLVVLHVEPLTPCVVHGQEIFSV